MSPFLAEILPSYPPDCLPQGTPAPAVAGFSGCRVWRLDAIRGPLCLRQWPAEHPTAAQLLYVHDVLYRVSAAGFPLVPLPIRSRNGDSFVHHGDHLWELNPWLPGQSDSSPQAGSPVSRPRVEGAAAALAQFHQAASVGEIAHCPAPGIAQRLGQLRALEADDLARLAGAVAARASLWPELAVRSAPLFALFRRAAPNVAQALREVAAASVSIQPCIRDIHRDHVLFEGDRVTGIIDFGAMRPDNVACDIARLLGSMALDNSELWQAGLAAYHQQRKLSDTQLRLVEAYDRSTVLLSGTNWLRWVFVEGREFENRPAVLRRFDEVAARLAHLADQTTPITV